MNVRKRGLALLMCICMIFTLLPFSVFAEDDYSGESITLQYWCTNARSTSDNASSKTVTLDYNSKPQYLADLAASTGSEAGSGLSTEYWKTMIQYGNDRQTNGANVDKTNSGTEISAIIRQDGKYYYYPANGSNQRVEIKSGAQITCYYQLVFANSENYGYISGSDWGYATKNNGGKNDAPYYVDYQLKLINADGTITDLSVSNKQWYHNNGVVKTINGIHCTANEKYIISKLEVYTGNDKTPSISEKGENIRSTLNLNRGSDYTVIYYLKEAESYTLNYVWTDAPDGMDAPEAAEYQSGKTAIVDKTYAANDTKADADGITWRFSGWFEDSQYKIAADSTITMDSSKTLYGYWQRLYTITYDYEGVKPSPAPALPDASKAAAGDTVKVEGIQLPSGWTFNGWTLDGERVSQSFKMPAKDIKIIGSFTRNSANYTVKYVWNNIEIFDSITGKAEIGTIVGNIQKEIEGYTVIPDEPTELTVGENGTEVTINYYKNVTLTANSGKFVYNGKEQSVSGYTCSESTDEPLEFIGTDGKEVTAGATGTEVNTYKAVFSGNAINAVADGLYIVTATEPGWLTIVAPGSAEVNLTAVKYYDGEPADSVFTFELKDKEGEVLQTKQNANDGTVTFDALTFDEKGTFTYYISEVKGTDKGIVYDETVYKVEIKVTLVGDSYSAKTNYYKVVNNELEPVDEIVFNNTTAPGTLVVKKTVSGNVSTSTEFGFRVELADTTYNKGGFTDGAISFTLKAGESKSLSLPGNAAYTVKELDSSSYTVTATLNGEDQTVTDGALSGTAAAGETITVSFNNYKAYPPAPTPKTALTITAGSAEGYGPDPVTCDKWTVEGLKTGDSVDSVTITGKQSVPGSSANVASNAVIKNAAGQDVTADYDIKYVDGTLTMIEILNKEIHFNYIVGYTDGTIRPENNISRAEIAAIFFRLLNDDVRDKFNTTDCDFSDVAEGSWCRRSIATLTSLGVISGYTDGTFRPDAEITRAELATIISRFANLDVNTQTFSDISGHWAQKYIELAAGNGWIKGYEDGTFRPDEKITRAETFAMINRVLNRQTENVTDLLPQSEMNMWSDNMDEDAWYYKDVQEATNYHKCERIGDSIYEKWTEKVPDIDWAKVQL